MESYQSLPAHYLLRGCAPAVKQRGHSYLKGTTWQQNQQNAPFLPGVAFWGMQGFDPQDARVISTRVGYSGGDVPNATIASVHSC